MAYSKTTWVNNETKLNADNMNKIEDGIEANSNDLEGMKKKISLYAEDGTLIGQIRGYMTSPGPLISIILGDATSGAAVEYELNGYVNKSGLQIINLRQLENMSLDNSSLLYSQTWQGEDRKINLFVRGTDGSLGGTNYVFRDMNDTGSTVEIDLYSEIQSLATISSPVTLVKCDATFSSWIGQGTVDMGSPSTWVRNIIDDTSNQILFLYDGTGENIWITSKATSSSDTAKGLYMHGGILYEMTLTYTTVELKALTNA